MIITQAQFDQILEMLQAQIPDWEDCSNETFQKQEIRYKRDLIEFAQDTLSQQQYREFLENKNYGEIQRRLEKIGQKSNLLWLSVPREGDLSFLYEEDLQPETLYQQHYTLLFGEQDTSERIDSFVTYLSEFNVSIKWTYITYFLFLYHPDKEIFIKPSVTKKFLKLLGFDEVYTSSPNGETYGKIQEMAHSLQEKLKEYAASDMIEVQSVMYVCAKYDNTSQPQQLGWPFFDLFADYEQADQAMDLIHFALEVLEISDPDDERYALTIPMRNDRPIHLIYGNNIVLGFYGYYKMIDQAGCLIVANKERVSESPERITYTYPLPESLPTVVTYILPMEELDHFEDRWAGIFREGLEILQQSYDHLKRANQRVSHVQPLAEGIFDETIRQELLTNGIDPAKIKEQPTDSDFPVEAELTLQQCADISGFPADQLQYWIDAIARKKQAVFYGPPGTGKTFLAQLLARHLSSSTGGFYETVQFHPSYAYEDFIQGIRPESDDSGALRYPMRQGRFVQFCERAENTDGLCVLIIDEINRANLSRVFGELMYLLEYRKQSIPLSSGGRFRIPENVRLIGTMNTADRSIALVDHALRRRFAFLALRPQYEVLQRFHQQNETGFDAARLIALLKELNTEIADQHYEVGISFFLDHNLSKNLESIWRLEIEPYLEEYFYSNPNKIERFRWERIRTQLAS